MNLKNKINEIAIDAAKQLQSIERMKIGKFQEGDQILVDMVKPEIAEQLKGQLTWPLRIVGVTANGIQAKDAFNRVFAPTVQYLVGILKQQPAAQQQQAVVAENKNKKPMTLKEFINKEVSKLHKTVMLESELKKINKELKVLNEGKEKSAEGKPYESNIYESCKKDLEEIVKTLGEACNRLESSVLKQERHISTLPEVEERMQEGKNTKQVILEIFKEVKKAKVAAERKLLEMR